MGRQIVSKTDTEEAPSKKTIGDLLMDFLNEQAQVARAARGNSDEAGLLDAEADGAFAQLTRRNLAATERALRQLLENDAGERRLAAILSIAVKHAMGKL